MACYHPIPAHQDQQGGELRLHPPVGTATLTLPCGNCLGCRTDRALDWARRAQHEASLWPHNCFLTLTYREEKLPQNGQLQAADLSAFLKRLRRCRDRHNPHLLSDRAAPLRFLACGEYGETTLRPHYHLCLFNCTFSDMYPVGKNLSESHLVEQLWPDGGHRLGTLTGASANYVAQYTVKKMGRTYATPDGEPLPAPFIRASKYPPLGHYWLKKYREDLKGGYLIADGRKGRVPRAYKKMLAKASPDEQQLSDTLAARAANNPRRQDNLQALETIHQARLRNAATALHGL